MRLRQYTHRPLAVIAAALAAACATPGTPAPDQQLSYGAGPSPASYEIADTLVLDINSPLGALEVVSGATVTVALAFAPDPRGMRVTGTVESLEATITNSMGPTETASLEDVSGVLEFLVGRYGVVHVALFPEVSGALAPTSSFPVLPYVLFPRLAAGVVDPGSTWTDTVTASVEGEVDLASTTVATYTLMGDTVVDGRPLVRIAVTSEDAIELQGDQQGTLIRQTLEGSANGFVLWDPERRLMAYGQFDRDLEGDMTMPGVPPIPVRITGGTVLRLGR